ncbi:MAG: hypothetical protein KGQ60_08640 [Planctomycetes bacterium]|nr:hypothetical protein [Planctomycetota bacterium]
MKQSNNSGDFEVLNTKSLQILVDILRRESGSLLSYVSGASLWTSHKTVPALTSIEHITKAHATLLTHLGQFVVKNKSPLPPMHMYPSSFTGLHFVSLKYLLPLLIQTEQLSTKQLEDDIDRLNNNVFPLLNELLYIKTNGLTVLQSIRV